MSNYERIFDVSNAKERSIEMSAPSPLGNSKQNKTLCRSSFFSLPLELRYMIYGYLAPETPVSAYLGLLLSSKEVYNEALPEIRKVHTMYYESYAKDWESKYKQAIKIPPRQPLGHVVVELPISLITLTYNEYCNGCPRFEEFVARPFPLASLPLESLTIRFVSQGLQPDVTLALRGISELLPSIFARHLYGKGNQFIPKALELHWGRFDHVMRVPHLWYTFLRNIADESEEICQALGSEAPAQWKWCECRNGGFLRETRVVGYRCSRL